MRSPGPTRSKRHLEVLRAIAYLRMGFGYPPSIREIGKEMSIHSTSVVTFHINYLVRERLVKKDPRVSRGITLTPLGLQQIATLPAEQQLPGIINLHISQVKLVRASNPQYHAAL